MILVGLLHALPQTLPFPTPTNRPPLPQRTEMDVERPLDLSGQQIRKSTDNPSAEKKSRFLSKKAVAILQHWYQKHRDHPYATDDEVKELALAGSIAPNQVKITIQKKIFGDPICFFIGFLYQEIQQTS